jgi:hypothetical protein
VSHLLLFFLNWKKEALPQTPIGGVLNNLGTKVRLTFKVWSQELWIQSATSTQKIPFQTIRTVQSEPIKGHEDYHIVVSDFPISFFNFPQVTSSWFF